MASAPPPPFGYPGQGPPPPGFQVPGGGYPNQGYPPSGYPQPGYPPQGYPQPGYPQAPPSYPGGPPPTQDYPYDNIYGNQPQQQQMYGSNYGNEDTDDVFRFSEKTIRQGFIRKVYGILTCQLLVTTSFIALCLYHLPTRKFIHTNSWLIWVAFAITLITLIVMSCCSGVRRKAPGNFVCLGIFTLAESFMLGTIASTYNSEEVILAAGITAVICFALSIFAFQTKWDFTVMGAGLFVAVIVLMLFGFIAMIFHGKIITLIYASLGALIFSLYLIYDTQMMIGGKHKYSISPEEYIFAALNLYIDVVQIFLYILTIIGRSRD